MKKFDAWGSFYVIVGMVSFIYAISNLNDFGWSSPTILISFTLFLLSVIAVAVQERRAESPILDFELFKVRVFWTSIIAALISFITMYSSTILIPFYYQKVLGYSPQAAGLFMMAFPLGMAVMAVFAGRLSDKIGYAVLTTGGMALNALALILLANVGLRTPLLQVLLAVFGMGASLGLFQAPNNSCIMGNVPKSKLGMRARTGLAYPDAFAPSAATVYYLAAGLSILGALFSVNRGPSQPVTVKNSKA